MFKNGIVFRRFLEADDGTGGGGVAVLDEPMTEEAMMQEAVDEINVEKGYEEAPAEAEKNSDPEVDTNPPEESDTEQEEGRPPKIDSSSSDDVIVEGDTVEEIQKNVEGLATRLGYDDKDKEILLQANFKKRFEDTRKSFNLKSQELADLKKSREEIPQVEHEAEDSRDGDPDSSEDMFEGLSDEAKETIEDTPELKELFSAQEAKMQTMLDKAFAKNKSDADSASQEQVVADQNKSWRDGISDAIPDGIDLYMSPEFLDWERQNANAIKAKVGHYDKYDPQGAIEQIRMYQKEKGLIADSKQRVADSKKKMRSGVAYSVSGHSTPQSRKTVGAPEGDLEAMTREAIDEINKEKGYNSRSNFRL